MKEIKVKVNIDAKQIIKELTQTKKEIKEIGISFIEMLGELKNDNTKMFKCKEHEKMGYKIIGTQLCVVDIENDRFEPSNMRAMDILTSAYTFIELKDYCETIKDGDIYFYIDRGVSVKENMYSESYKLCRRDKLRRNIFRTANEAMCVARKFSEILER